MSLFDDTTFPCPEGAKTGFITTPDGVRLRYARWRPKGQSKGTVSLFQGRTEFIEKYYEMIGWLLNEGYGVATLDWRGQGLSDRLTRTPFKGHVRRFSDYDTDLDTFINDVVLPDCPGPHYALGHSMGGHILVRNSADNRLPYERMVLTAPMLALVPKGVPWGLAEAIATLARGMGLGKLGLPGGKKHGLAHMAFPGNPLTHDERRFERNKAMINAHDALNINSPTFGWLKAALKSIREINDVDFIQRISTPMLILAAGEDPVVSTPDLEDFGAMLLAGHTVRVPRSLHELMMEEDRVRLQVLAAFKAFVPGEPYLSPAELALIGRSTSLKPEERV